MIREYKKLSKKWKKVVKRYNTIKSIWIHYKEEETDYNKKCAREYFYEMMAMESMADILGYDLHELERSYRDWLKTNTERNE